MNGVLLVFNDHLKVTQSTMSDDGQSSLCKKIINSFRLDSCAMFIWQFSLQHATSNFVCTCMVHRRRKIRGWSMECNLCKLNDHLKTIQNSDESVTMDKFQFVTINSTFGCTRGPSVFVGFGKYFLVLCSKYWHGDM